MTSPNDDHHDVGAPPTESDVSVEPGAIIRSPAPESPAEPPAPESRWPWEASHDPATANLAPKIEAGPTVRTEDLYRVHAADSAAPSGASVDASGNSIGATSPATPEFSGAEAADQPTAETIAPMSTAVAPEAAYISVAPEPERGIGAWAVFGLVVAVTTVVGFIDMTMNREFTWFTGAAFVIASIIGAVMVRPRDLWTAVITPPLAFLIALIVAGQPSTLTGSGSLLLREAQLIGTGLAFNAPYIFGGTAAALIIVLIRRAMLGKRLK